MVKVNWKFSGAWKMSTMVEPRLNSPNISPLVCGNPPGHTTWWKVSASQRLLLVQSSGSTGTTTEPTLVAPTAVREKKPCCQRPV